MKTLNIKLLLCLLLITIFCGCISFTHHTGNYQSNLDFINTHTHYSGTVVKVTDGDTDWILLENGSKIKVRLLGVDTPEIYHENDCRKWTYNGKMITDETWLYHWGVLAKQYAEEKIGGKKVIIVFDNIAPKKGYYGRYLVYVFYWNGTGYEDFNEDLLKNGYARVYSYYKNGEWIIPNFELKNKFLQAERYAQTHYLGVWSWFKNNN